MEHCRRNEGSFEDLKEVLCLVQKDQSNSLGALFSLKGFNDINGGGFPDEGGVGGGSRAIMVGGRGGPTFDRVNQRRNKQEDYQTRCPSGEEEGVAVEVVEVELSAVALDGIERFAVEFD